MLAFWMKLSPWSPLLKQSNQATALLCTFVRR